MYKVLIKLNHNDTETQKAVESSYRPFYTVTDIKKSCTPKFNWCRLKN